MKNIFIYTFIIATSLLVLSCRDDDKVRIPDFEKGVNARVVVRPENSVLNFVDIDNSAMVFDVYSENKNIDEITYSVTLNDASFPQKSFPVVDVLTVPGSAFVNGKASGLTISATQLADKLGLQGGAAYVEGGDKFTFFATVKLTDGRIFNADNTSPNITGGTGSSFTQNFTLFVSCPFVVDDAIGTYKMVADPGDWSPLETEENIIEVVAGPGTNQVTMKNAFGFDEALMLDVILDVDPLTGVATMNKQKSWDGDYWFPGDGYGIGSTEGKGFFFSCSGAITLDLAWTAGAASFGNYNVGYQKQ